MNHRWRRAAISPAMAILAALMWSCASWFSSATLRITYYLADGIWAAEDELTHAQVDLGESPDWQEHHDQVKGISRVLFAFWVKNLTQDDAAAQFYISTDSSLATAQQVRERATLVLDGLSVPGSDSIYVTAKESYRYFRHLDVLTESLIQGRFCLYCIAEQDSFIIQVPDSAALVIEFTHAVDWEF